ncbi:MAG TPA: alkaline phosphatase D family protein [Caulobacteraceae bacterium]|nr:alkaline phosphatase D family protein [Caulobacteraceae bacterium]
MTLTRRSAFALAAGAAAFLNARGTRAAAPARFVRNPFKLGVASGDPSQDGLTIWTRLAPNPMEPDGGAGSEPIEVRYQVAEDAGFKRVVRDELAVAHPERAHSVHVDLYGLEPGRPYWYRFEAGGVRSPVGRGVTLPAPTSRTERLKLGVASCQHYEQGWFTPYRDMVAWNPDLILHLGDYIYESSWGPQLRRHPTLEPRTLDEYRVHHAVYKLDADMQAAHAHTSWAFTWDDHEVENDYAGLTPQQIEDAAEFPERRARAYQAWFEHLPVSRRSLLSMGEMRIYQELLYGDLAQLLMVDYRQYRSPRACITAERWRSGVVDCPELTDPKRTALGEDQDYWFGQTFGRGNSRWQVLGQATLFSHLDQKTPAGTPGSFNDGWSGYPVTRQRMLDRIARRKTADTVILGGDMHAFWTVDVRAQALDPASPIVATEFVGTSITSQSTSWDRFNQILKEGRNEHVKFFDDRQRGWMAAEVTRDRWNVDFRVVDSVATKTPAFSSLKRWAVEHGKAGAQEA